MNFEKTPQNTLKRAAHKASYNKEEVNAILDAAEICYVAFLVDGKPMVQPINFGRNQDKLYLHGSVKNRMTQALIDSGEVSLNVTHLDSMKLTRSAFHHSVNFRSVVVFGTVKELITHEEKLVGLKSIINHFVPNRWEYCRQPDDNELKATRVLEISITSASAKIAVAPPQDKTKDLELDYWAGTIPVKTMYGEPIAVEGLNKGVGTPKHVREFVKSRNP
jgi:nitroimidazol reductase NimA-like FMN-containing flavoprotein (pyridoxamine 5'-phosphate oxidase superfamily)